MTTFFKFPCGCRWPVVGPPPREGALPLLDVNDEELPFCQATWDLLAKGDCKGIFQLESPLGRQWCKRLRPTSGEHVGALGAILRPGALRSVDEDGISMTTHYVLRKNKLEEVKSYHPAIDEILKSTFGCLIYQEPAMEIVKAVAGFSLQDADRLRKACGKKDTMEMAQVELAFLEGAAKEGIITQEQAREVFGWIKASQRYAFNRCVSGVEKLRRAAKGKYYDSNAPFTVAEMYRIRNDLDYAKATGHQQLRRKWNRLGNYGKGLSLCADGRVRPNLIRDIRPSGRQAVYKVLLDSGATISVTDNHNFPTADGKMTVAEMMSGLTAGQEVVLYTCGEYAAGRTKRGEKGYPAVMSGVVSIVPDGEEETYDVEMEGPNHNFVTGQNIVTCNSHAVSYGLTGYDTAYIKAHFPVSFYCSWLRFAHEKPDPMREVYELVNDAKLNDVAVLPPDLRNMEPHFSTDGVGVTFGLTDIRGLGLAQLAKIKEAVAAVEKKINKPLASWGWNDFLFHASAKIGKTSVENLIKGGALRWFGVLRTRMLNEFDLFGGLTPAEKEWVRSRELVAAGLVRPASLLGEMPPPPPARQKAKLREWEHRKALFEALQNQRPFRDLAEAVRCGAKPRGDGGAAANVHRVSKLASIAKVLTGLPAGPYEDRPDWVACTEEEILGIPLTCSKVDAFDAGDVNTSCKDFAAGKTGYMVFGVKVDQVREVRTKRGKNPGQKMAFLSVSDSSCALGDVVVFPEEWKQYGGILAAGECVLMHAERDQKSNGLVVKRVSTMAR